MELETPLSASLLPLPSYPGLQGLFVRPGLPLGPEAPFRDWCVCDGQGKPLNPCGRDKRYVQVKDGAKRTTRNPMDLVREIVPRRPPGDKLYPANGRWYDQRLSNLRVGARDGGDPLQRRDGPVPPPANLPAPGTPRRILGRNPPSMTGAQIKAVCARYEANKARRAAEALARGDLPRPPPPVPTPLPGGERMYDKGAPQAPCLHSPNSPYNATLTPSVLDHSDTHCGCRVLTPLAKLG